MDIYKQALAYLSDLSPLGDWPEMRLVLENFAARKPREWKLPFITCQALGGGIERVIPAVGAIACMQISIILIDDILDSDPRGYQHRIGLPETVNLALAFQATGFKAIQSSQAGASTRLAVLEILNQMVITTSLGQHLDAGNPTDERGYWRLIRTKSSPFFSAALLVGYLLGDGSPEKAAAIKQFGDLYGEMIQVHDDLNDTMAVPANPDWTLGRMPLPILYAHTVDHPEKARFLELRQAIPDPLALTEAQTLLVRIGAVSYCIDQILHRYHAARKILSALVLPEKAGLESLLEGVVEPVKKLSLAAGLPHTALLSQPTGIVI